METAAYAFYDAFDDDPDSAGTVVAVLTDETLSHFKRRSANTLFLMKTRQNGKRKKLVAMACLTKKDKSHKLLHTVYVNAAYRNAGIGKALVKAALSIAKRDGMALSLSVNPLNEAAMQLYESTGFRISNG